VDALPENTFPAKLDSVSPLTEQSFTDWPPTRSFKAYASVAQADPRLRPGMNAGADFVVTRIPDALSVPAKALFVRDGKPAVYVKTSGGFEPRMVDVEARNTDEVAVRGIDGGARVALEDPAKTGAGR
jgi:multidrug efflux pump subunit AcrA (membrane-fusion protein)